MTLGHRILVPLDGSRFAEAAVPVAATLARRCGGALRLVVVHAPLPLVERGGGLPDLESTWERATRRELERYLADVRERAAREGNVEVEAELRSGDAAEQIHSAGEAWPADLVVLAAHGRGGFSRAWLGSVTDVVIRTADVPVLVVRPSSADEVVDLGAERDFDPIVIPLDGSRLAESVLEPALSLAKIFGATCTLCRVVQPGFMVDAPHVIAGLEINAELLRQWKWAAEEYLGRVRARVGEQGLVCDAVVVVGPSVAESVLELGSDDANSLFAIATHGRGGFGRLLLGSVADKLVRAADRPVLVVRPTGTRS